jgi:hypothetical protein
MMPRVIEAHSLAPSSRRHWGVNLGLLLALGAALILDWGSSANPADPTRAFSGADDLGYYRFRKTVTRFYLKII